MVGERIGNRSASGSGALRRGDGHAGLEQLERYLLGDCAEEDCAWLEEHLLICAACRDRLAEHERYVNAMRRAAAEWRATHPPKDSSER
jgi:predicted anti-sigma-YlaC factor YlaD